MIDKFLKFLPIGTLIVILCGFTKLYLYYSFFFIDVTPYLTLTDLFNLFLSDSIYIAIILSGPIFSLINELKLESEILEEKIRTDERTKVYTKVIEDLKNMAQKFPEVKNITEENIQTPLKNKKKPVFTIITLILISLYIFLLFQKQTIIITYSYLSLAAFIPTAFFRSLDNTKFDLQSNFMLITFSVSLIFLVLARINLDYFNSTNPKNEVKIETISGEIYNCNKYLLKVGNTETYTFLYDKSSSTSFIIRNDNIKKIKSVRYKNVNLF